MAPIPAILSFKLGGFDLDRAGGVAQGGSWKTTADNKILVVASDSTTKTFDVQWSFNADNQLVLSAGGAQLFIFNADPGVTPRFETRNSVLRITPNILNAFAFELRGEWNLTADHDLEFVPLNGVKSTIKGFISSPDGKFIFFFNAKARPLLKHKLGFVGTWDLSKKAEGQLVFNFKREDGTVDKFELPAKITVNRTTNQLRYEYQKGGTQAIDFEGTLIVNENFTITYHISRRLSQAGETMVGETTLTLGAMFQKNSFTGNLELTLLKPDGTAGTTTLTIGGRFAGVIGKTNVAVGFQFDQIREGQRVTTTFAFAGRVEFFAGTIQFAFSTSNAATRTISLALEADIKLGPANIDAKFNVDMGPGGAKGITFLLGTSF